MGYSELSEYAASPSGRRCAIDGWFRKRPFFLSKRGRRETREKKVGEDAAAQSFGILYGVRLWPRESGRSWAHCAGGDALRGVQGRRSDLFFTRRKLFLIQRE